MHISSLTNLKKINRSKMNIRSGIKKSITKSKKRCYLKKSSICLVRKFGLSSGMKCPVFPTTTI